MADTASETNFSIAASSEPTGNEPIEDLTDEQLYLLIENQLNQNRTVENETAMFERFLQKIEEKEGAQLSHLMSTGMMSASSSSLSSEQSGPGRMAQRKRSKSKAAIDKTTKLTAEQKCEIAQKEQEDIQEEKEKYDAYYDKMMDRYTAIFEESQLKMGELIKVTKEFERDISHGGRNDRSGVIIAEKVLKYIDDRNKSRETLMEKMRLKNSALKGQKQKLKLQLKQKEDTGEVLHPVDYNQLKIENSQYLEKIDEKNKELLHLKSLSGKTMNLLNAKKREVSLLTKENAQLKLETKSRKEMLQRVLNESRVAEEERQAAEAINKRIRAQIEEYRVPDVMDYVQTAAEDRDLTKKIKTWERKADIAEMALTTQQKNWNKMMQQDALATKL